MFKRLPCYFITDNFILLRPVKTGDYDKNDDSLHQRLFQIQTGC